MRTTVTLDQDVFEAAQTLSRTSGKGLGKVISELARLGLEKANPRAPDGGRFATFDVPANSPMIPAGRIQKILDDEGGA
jgi:hypothetical protein